MDDDMTALRILATSHAVLTHELECALAALAFRELLIRRLQDVNLRLAAEVSTLERRVAGGSASPDGSGPSRGPQ